MLQVVPLIFELVIVQIYIHTYIGIMLPRVDKREKYVTIHGENNHIALGLHLRYEPNKSPGVISLILTFWHELIEESFLYTNLLHSF